MGRAQTRANNRRQQQGDQNPNQGGGDDEANAPRFEFRASNPRFRNGGFTFTFNQNQGANRDGPMNLYTFLKTEVKLIQSMELLGPLLGVQGNLGDYAFGANLEDIISRTMNDASHGAPPASSEAISDLKKGVVSKTATGIDSPLLIPFRSHLDEKQSCAVCMVEYEEEDEVTTLPCEHFFHSGCITPWLKLALRFLCFHSAHCSIILVLFVGLLFRLRRTKTRKKMMMQELTIIRRLQVMVVVIMAIMIIRIMGVGIHSPSFSRICFS